MLQQTTVAAVVPYFERFLAKFPDVRSLAAANIDDVLRLWEGLGYYSRARNLHKAAMAIERDHGGVFPNDADALQLLPGVGRYTAGAIASFAFDQPAPIVEANTERLYARLMALTEDVRSSASQRLLWDYATEIVPRRRPGDFNQALMDIGSQICQPNQPNCPACPLKSCCEAFASGNQNELPVRKPRIAITKVDEICVVIRSRNKYLLRRRSEGERWAGMWDFVRLELSAAEVKLLPTARNSYQAKTKISAARNVFRSVYNGLPDMVQKRILEQIGAKVGRVVAALEFSYSVTRYRVRLKSFLCDSNVTRNSQAENTQWFTARELVELPLSRTGRQVADWLASLADH